MDSRQFCHAQGGLLRWPGRDVAGKLSWTLFLFSCIGVILVPTSGYALRHKERNSLASPAAPLPDSNAKEQTVTCPAAAQPSGSPTELSGTLSEAVSKLLLQCEAGTTVVPTGLTQGLVCPADVPGKDLTKCKDATAGSGEKQAVSLSQLMGGPTSPEVTWEKQPEGTGGKLVYSLSLPPAPLPLVDSSFLTGCKTQDSQHCVVTVSVEARKSAASGQTVYCAYGKNSNDPTKRPTVTMTTKDNKMTLVCGNKDKTVVQPKNYTTHYCPDEKVGDVCTTAGEYKSFITDFQETWWTKDDATDSVTLTIPPEHFPATAKTIHLGCQYKPPAAEDTQKAAAAGQPTACVVDVVISPKESAGKTVAVLPSLAVGGIALAVSVALRF